MMGRHQSFSAGAHIPALRDDPSPKAQDFTWQSSNCLIRNAMAGAEHGWLWATGENASRASRIFIVNASIDQAAICLGMATLMGACIGFERQWRQRMAGLRTNTLVAIGAASFVVFESLFPDDGSPTRVAAQVVSGIGFPRRGHHLSRGTSRHRPQYRGYLVVLGGRGAIGGKRPSAARGAGDGVCRSGQSDLAAAGSDHQPAADRTG